MTSDADDGNRSEPWIRMSRPDAADGELAEAYDRIGARDRVASIIGIHSLHPAAMVAHVRLYRTVMFGSSPLSRRQREAVAVAVSAANDCFY